MLNFVGTIVGIIADILSIFDIQIKRPIKNIKVILCGIFGVVGVSIIILATTHFAVTVTQVTVNENQLSMRINEKNFLSATVMYSNQSIDNEVVWASSNPTVATVDVYGQVTAVGAGITTISAYAKKHNSGMHAECIVAVKSPPSGYAISVQQTAIDSYVYINIKPYDNDVTKIQIYGRSPSGEIFTPNMDKNNLYHFYTESGTWTVYASLENEGGIYEAHRPEDFVTIDVTDISSNYLGTFMELFP